MRDKATLSLMELLVMVLVFSLAAALCLKAFVWSTQQTQKNKVTAQAAIVAQTTAETLKASKPETESRTCYDEGWREDENGCYVVTAQPFRSGLLGGAEIEVADRAGESIFRLSVRWQEDAA